MSLQYLIRLLKSIDDSFSSELPIVQKKPTQDAFNPFPEQKKKLSGLAEFSKFAIPESQLPEAVLKLRRETSQDSSSSPSSSSSSPTNLTEDQQREAEQQQLDEDSQSTNPNSAASLQTRSTIGQVLRLGDGPLTFGEKGDAVYAKCLMQGCWVVEAVVKLKTPTTAANGKKVDKIHTYSVNSASPYLLEPLQSLSHAVRLAKTNISLYQTQMRAGDIDETALSLLMEAQRAIAFASAVLYERNAPHWQTAGLSTTKTFKPKLPQGLSIQFTVERLGIVLYIYSSKTQAPVSIFCPSPTIVLLSTVLVDALQHLQVLLRNAQAQLYDSHLLISID